MGNKRFTGNPAESQAPSAATHNRLQRKIVIAFAIITLYFLLKRLSIRMTNIAAPRDDLSGYRSSIYLPFKYGLRSQNTPVIIATINGTEEFELPVDTGSTGLLIGAPRLPWIGPDEGTPAYQYFTSSKILYTGRLVKLSVSFRGAEDSFATATVDVLVVDRSIVCPWFEPGKDPLECPLEPGQPKPTPRDTSRIVYMGVGFGRNRVGDGRPNGLPAGNPLLNIDSINNVPIQPGSLRAGYTVSTKGVHVGLTRDNTHNFTFLDLEPGVAHAQDPRDWAMVKTSFSLDGDAPESGSALIDTGVAQMYITVRDPSKVVRIRNPNEKGIAEWVNRVKPGTKISVGFPSLDHAALGKYSFEVGNGGAVMEPSYTVSAKQTSPPYVNTGRNFLFGYSIAFDAVGGRFGFRPVDPELKI